MRHPHPHRQQPPHPHARDFIAGAGGSRCAKSHCSSRGANSHCTATAAAQTASAAPRRTSAPPAPAGPPAAVRPTSRGTPGPASEADDAPLLRHQRPLHPVRTGPRPPRPRPPSRRAHPRRLRPTGPDQRGGRAGRGGSLPARERGRGGEGGVWRGQLGPPSLYGRPVGPASAEAVSLCLSGSTRAGETAGERVGSSSAARGRTSLEAAAAPVLRQLSSGLAAPV